jgi:carbon monoxide dehydrogenase subunit G
MALETIGEVTVDTDCATAFAFVRDPQRLGDCIPGCRDLREIGPQRYSATLTGRVAFMTLTFKVFIDVIKLEPPGEIEARITGDAVGLSGRLAATARLQLTEADGPRTTIRYKTEVGLTGRLGGLGQPVFRATSTQLAREFGANLKQGIEAVRTETRA